MVQLREAKKHDFVNEDGTLRTDLVKDFALADGTKLQAHLVGVYHDPRTNNSGNAGMSFIVTVPVEEAPMCERQRTRAAGKRLRCARSSMANSSTRFLRICRNTSLK